MAALPDTAAILLASTVGSVASTKLVVISNIFRQVTLLMHFTTGREE